MKRIIIAGALALAFVECGGGSTPAISQSASPTAAASVETSSHVELEVGGPELAIGLEGNVKQKDQTHFEATGQEIVCSAMLIRDSKVVPVSSEVEWKTEGAGGKFSQGTRGVFFLPDSRSDVKIYAVYEGDSGIKAVSPALTLSFP